MSRSSTQWSSPAKAQLIKNGHALSCDPVTVAFVAWSGSPHICREFETCLDGKIYNQVILLLLSTSVQFFYYFTTCRKKKVS